MIYVSLPVTHSNPAVVAERVRAAAAYTAKLLHAGLIVFCPAVYSEPLVRQALPTAWEFWRRLDMKFLALCDEIHVLQLPGWPDSEGVAAEIEESKRLGLELVFADPPFMSATLKLGGLMR